MPNDGVVNLGDSFSGPANEGQWSMVLGGIPIVLHEHGGWSIPFNHNYLELRDGDGNTLRRIHSREVDMQGSGEMLTGVYGSEHLPFAEDVIGNNDPHKTNPNMLRDGADPEYVGAIVTGTPQQVLGVYHQTLQGVIGIGNRNFEYNALGFGLNGNTVTAELVEITHRAAEAQGVEVAEFDPRGMDIDYRDTEIDSSHIGGEICYDGSPETLLNAIAELEETIAKQHEFTMAEPKLDTQAWPSQESKLECDHSDTPSVPGR